MIKVMVVLLCCGCSPQMLVLRSSINAFLADLLSRTAIVLCDVHQKQFQVDG